VTISNVERAFVLAADAMPEEKYGYAPTNGEFNGVRTFAEQLKHVAADNYMFAAAILEEKPPVEWIEENGPASIKTKANIIKFLKGSFAYLHKAAFSITAENALDSIKFPFGDSSTIRLAMVSLIAGHSFDHYGQMVEYLRMNGIVPPAFAWQ
jgi:uncharacterized damage-inducible protein DinB